MDFKLNKQFRPKIDKYKIINFCYFEGIYFLYYSVGKYEDFSLQKSISSCTIAKSKIKNISPQEARKLCETEIKK